MTVEVVSESVTQVVETLHRRIVDLLQRNSGNPQKRLIIAIAGVPGSGKSTISGALQSLLRSHGVGNLSVLPMDGFHYPKSILSQMENPGRAFERRGAPFTFDVHALIKLIKKVRTTPVTPLDEPTLAIRAPSFDHAVQDPVQEDIYLSSSDRIVILEGNYVLLNEAPWSHIAELVDETYFVDVPPVVARDRLIQRHLRSGIESTEAAAAARAEMNDIPNGELIRSKLIQPHLIIAN